MTQKLGDTAVVRKCKLITVALDLDCVTLYIQTENGGK
jgi:hypothetical protein